MPPPGWKPFVSTTSSVALFWFNLGVVLEDQGRAAEAIAAYEHALALDAAPGVTQQVRRRGGQVGDAVDAVFQQARCHLLGEGRVVGVEETSAREARR